MFIVMKVNNHETRTIVFKSKDFRINFPDIKFVAFLFIYLDLTAATFGHENTTNSFATVIVNEEAREVIKSILDISMFIRTRKSTGTILYLGSMPDQVSYAEETLIAAELEAGELLVHLQFNATPEKYPVSGVKLHDGYNHLIQVKISVSYCCSIEFSISTYRVVVLLSAL